MSPATLTAMLALAESETLDFKRQFHDNPVTLLHDILCLANAYAAQDRYLVLGVADDRQITGVEADANRKRNAEIQDLLRGSLLNRIPDARLEEVTLQGHVVAVLTIKNRPEKPFFATRDKMHGQQRLRAGVVYTRIGDTNIPLTESAPDDRVELMWRERFGLSLPPLERFRRLLRERDQWEVQEHGEGSVLHHRASPEFTIVDGEELVDGFSESWSKRFPDSRASSLYVELRHDTTILRKVVLVHCDGFRYRIPLPRKVAGRWTIDQTDLGYLVAQLYRQYQPLEEALALADVDLVGDDAPRE